MKNKIKKSIDKFDFVSIIVNVHAAVAEQADAHV